MNQRNLGGWLASCMNLQAQSKPRVGVAGDTDCGWQIAECGLILRCAATIYPSHPAVFLKTNSKLSPAETYECPLHRPDLVQQAHRGEPLPPPKL
jgi:hypothetical protein